MPFCRSCGAELPAPPPVQCPRCGTWEWDNAKPAASALVADGDGRLLLVRRAHEPWRDHWTAPGGFCDRPEHPIAAAERETREEAGLAVEITGYLGTWLSPYDDETIAVAYYHARPTGDTRCDPDSAEVAEARWFEAGSLPSPVAPPGTFGEVLAAWRRAVADGTTTTPLYDRPTRAR